MSFLDKIVEENANNTEIQIRGHSGLFRYKFDLDDKNRILKVYQIIGKERTSEVKKFNYNKKTNILFAETHLSYFGNVRFLVKWI